MNPLRPKRPDSAKTQQTKKTLDSEPSKNDLTSSKFSQTFSSGVNSFHEEPDKFKQYVAEKEKDPKFKHLKKLEVIPEKSGKKVEESKVSFKPFEKKKESTVQKNKKIVQEKPEQAMNRSGNFVQKYKKKLNSLNSVTSQQKQQSKQQQKEQKIKSKIKFDAFKLNVPGQKRQSKKQIKPQAKKQQIKIDKSNQEKQQKPVISKRNRWTNKTQQEQLARQQEMMGLQRYVNDVQARNMVDFPSNYDQLLAVAPEGNFNDLEKIDLNDFLNDPTEGDYQLMKNKIKKLDRQLQSQKMQESINLQEIIYDQEEEEKEMSQKQEIQRLKKLQTEEEQSYLGSMTTSQLKKRNAFITQILTGKISKKDIQKMQQMDKSGIRMHKLDHQKMQEEDEVQLPQINMMKRQSHRLMERNRIEASGQLYRDCDYLSEEHKKRLDELLNGQIGDSPFEGNDLDRLKSRRIDEGIRMYREMSASQQTQQILNQDSLPKDPELRKQAQKKILRQKMSSVNQRLAATDKVIVTKAKIESLIKKFQHTRTTATYQALCLQNQAKYQQQIKKIKDAEQMINHLCEKQNLEEVMNQIQKQFKQLEEELKQISELDQKELVKMQKERLKRKLKEVENIQKLNNELEGQIDQLERMKNDAAQSLQFLDRFQNIEIPNLQCEGYKQSETIDDIDTYITRKMQQQNRGQSNIDQ